MVRRSLYVAVLAFCVATVPAPSAVTDSHPSSIVVPGERHVLHADPRDLNFSYGPKMRDLQRLSLDANALTANITVTYSGFSAEAQAAFQAAVNIWASTIASPVPIRIRANWKPLPTGVLGGAGTTNFCFSSGGITGVAYVAALADKLAGRSFCATGAGETAEIEADFNSSFTGWEFGTTGVGVPGRYNFMTVVLHEIGHGLGFMGGFYSDGVFGDHIFLDTAPLSYDWFAVSGGGIWLYDLPRPSAQLHSQLTSNNTFFGGAQAAARNGGFLPKLETHHMTAAYGASSLNGWKQGSSYSHVDDVLYSGTSNGLMTWQLGANEVYTDVGPITKGILQDQGWTISNPAPAAPTLSAPAGTITTRTPTFTWSAVAGATSYDLYVAIPFGAAVINMTDLAPTVCTGAICSQASPVSLPTGQDYVWWVRAKNAFGPGDWSASLQFRVTLPGPPATTVVAPSGPGTPRTPTYTWNVVGSATFYYLWVQPIGGAPAIQTWYPSGAVCGPVTCSVTPSTELLTGVTYNAWVQTWNADNFGGWSPTVTFSTSPMTTTGPTGTVNTPAPIYTWNRVPGAITYDLWVEPTGGAPVVRTLVSDATCGATTCSVVPRNELANGPHSWWVRPLYGSVSGAWSAEGTFAVDAVTPGATSPIWPLAAPEGARMPAYKWSHVANSTWYRLWVAPVGGGPVILTWYFAGDVCQGSVCTVRPAVALTSGGRYTWWIQTWSSRGVGPWDSGPGTTFTIAATAPAGATQVAPAGSGVAASPTYTWNRVPGSSWYYLWVNPVGAGPLVQMWYRAEDVCGATTCSVTPAVNLPGATTFEYWLRTFNDAGYGPWTSSTFDR
jgi:hypothetical protein